MFASDRSAWSRWSGLIGLISLIGLLDLIGLINLIGMISLIGLICLLRPFASDILSAETLLCTIERSFFPGLDFMHECM